MFSTASEEEKPTRDNKEEILKLSWLSERVQEKGSQLLRRRCSQAAGESLEKVRGVVVFKWLSYQENICSVGAFRIHKSWFSRYKDPEPSLIMSTVEMESSRRVSLNALRIGETFSFISMK